MADDVWSVTMPKLGESVTEGTVVAWLKGVGDDVAFDDPLLEVSTDKVDSEIPSPYDGVLLEILVPADQAVPIGTLLARIGAPGAQAAGSAGQPEAGQAEPVQTEPAQPEPGQGAPAGSATPPVVPGRWYSPIVRRLAAEHGLDLTTVTGTGEGGRVRREDVQALLAARQAVAVDLDGLSRERSSDAAPATPTRAAQEPQSTGDPRERVEPLSRMRLAVAAGMVASVAAAPAVWTSIEVDYENVEQVRRRHKEAFREQTGASLSYLPFVARATCDALRSFPAVNAAIDIEAKTMTYHPYVNLGIAVDLNEQGLIVPVLRDADQFTVRGLATRIKRLGDAGRGRQLGADDLRGSTFTITNPGPLGTFASAPIINQPNVAIMCTDGVSRKPVVVGDAIAIHHVGVIGLVYDHRAFDGVTASKFLLAVRTMLQDRDWALDL